MVSSFTYRCNGVERLSWGLDLMNASLKLTNRLIVVDAVTIIKHSLFIEISSLDPLQWDYMHRHAGFISKVMISFDLKLKAVVDITGSMDYGSDEWIVT